MTRLEHQHVDIVSGQLTCLQRTRRRLFYCCRLLKGGQVFYPLFHSLDIVYSCKQSFYTFFACSYYVCSFYALFNPIRVSQAYNYNDMLGRLLYVEASPSLIMHTSPLVCLKHSPPISIHINVSPCDGIRDLAKDFHGIRRGGERWELNVRSNGGYKRGSSLSPSSSSLCQLSRKLGHLHNGSVDAYG